MVSAATLVVCLALIVATSMLVGLEPVDTWRKWRSARLRLRVIRQRTPRRAWDAIRSAVSFSLTAALVVHFSVAGLPAPIAEVVAPVFGRVGPVVAAAATLPPNIAGTTAHLFGLKWWDKSHLFTMSDGARVVIYYDGTFWGYKIRTANGSWGTFTPLVAPSSVYGTVFTQVADTIYGAESQDVARVQILKLVYSGGSITQSNVAASRPNGPGGNYGQAVYWDSTNSYLHVLYWDDVGGVAYLDAYDSTLVNRISIDITSYGGTGDAGINSLFGSGANSFFLSWWPPLTGLGQVTAISASATAYTLTAETSVSPATPAQFGNHVTAIWDGSNVVFAAARDGLAIETMSRTAPNSYTSWQTLLGPDPNLGLGSGPFLVRKGTGPASDLALLFVGSEQAARDGIVWSFQRLGGAWFGPVLRRLGMSAM
jgi:hypothetical protein